MGREAGPCPNQFRGRENGLTIEEQGDLGILGWLCLVVVVRIPVLNLAIILLASLAGNAAAQFKEDTLREGKAGAVVTHRWRVGMIVTADGGGFKRITGTLAVPMDWPEQRVRTVAEDLSPGVSVSYQVIDGAVRQMTVRIPLLARGEEAKAIVTFEIKRLLPVAPDDTENFVLPNAKRLDRKTAIYLAPSPMIESNSPEIKAAAKEAGAGKEKAWEKVEAIYDWVREKITFHDNRGAEVKSAAEALRLGDGDCDEMSSLFVALCRANEIPARMVRVPGHCYPEFYLLDADGKGHWFPCQAAGTRAFGAMPDPRPVLQKGDNLMVVDPQTKKKTRQRFLPENLVGFATEPGGKLKLKQVCERANE